jgi:hypothetical protein
MKTPHLLVVASAISALVLGSLMLQGQFARRAVGTAVTAETSGEYSPLIDQGGGVNQDVGILAGEIHQLRQELASLKAGYREIAVMQNAIAGLREDLATLREDIAIDRGVSGYLAERSEKDSPDTSGDYLLDPAAISLENSAGDYQRLRDADDTFSAEYVDESWSAETSRLISDSFASGDFSYTSLDGIECRSSTCRVSVHHSDPQAEEEFIMKFPQAVSEALPTITFHYEDYGNGQIGIVMFLERDAEPF